MHFRDRFFASQDDRRLYFRDGGDPLSARTPVLCLAGLTRSSRDFTALASRLAEKRRVLCLDYRGRGRSQYDPNWRNYTAETCLMDIRHLLAVAGVDRVVVIGTSFGGLLGLGLAVMMPNAISGLVMNDVGPEIVPGPFARLVDLIGRDHPLSSWDEAVPYLKQMFPALAFQDESAWPAAARHTWREGSDGKLHVDWDINLARALSSEPPPPMWHLFRAVRRIPVLALRGSKSDILSPQCFARMAVEKPDLVAVEIPGAAHVPTLDEPEARAAVDDFLARF
jgi:pimeloyl-ACP methyl ester carboxylesterase